MSGLIRAIANRWMLTIGALGLLFVLIPLVTVAAAPFDDVPAGHWTYGALEQLSVADLIDGYPPGFFSGTRRLTRYEMALSLAGALERLTEKREQESGTSRDSWDEVVLADMIAAYNRSVPRRGLTAAEGELLRAVVAEFTPELQMLGHRAPRTDYGTEGTDSRWLLDASVGQLAREMLQNTGSPVDIWFAGPQQADMFPMAPAYVAPVQIPAPTDGLAPGSGGGAIGRIGTTVLYAEPAMATVGERRAGDGPSPALDHTIHLGAQLLPEGAGGRDPGLGPWHVTETRTAVDEVSLGTNVSLSGHRTQRTSAQGDAAATHVNATVLLGDVSIDGKLRSVDPHFAQRFATEDGAGADALGLGLTIRLGDVSLSTGRDLVHRANESNDAEGVTSEVVRSFMLEYSFTETALVRAGWQSVSDARERTSVDVSVPVPLGALHLGLAYEGARSDENVAISMTTLTMAGLDLKLHDNAEARAAVALRDTGLSGASLGLRYTLNSEAAVLLGYQYIDFDENDDREQNVTTAEFSIRF